jgi:hypothetical protein
MKDQKPIPTRVLSEEELDDLREKTTENPGTLPYAHHSGSALVKPIDKGRVKGLAVVAMQEQTTAQLKQIYEQVRILMDQAQAIKDRIDVSERIYLADISFKPVIGKNYFLYSRDQVKDVMSLVAPEEWGRSMPFHSFVAEVKLLSDHTWEIVRQ